MDRPCAAEGHRPLGRSVGYWIRKAHPSDGLLAPPEDLASWDYVPAKLHPAASRK